MTDASNQYGHALYELAKEEGLLEEVLSQLKVLDDVFTGNPQFVTLLNAPSVPKAERCRIIDDSFRGKLHPYVLNFLKILTEKGYMRHFSGCCKVFRRSYNDEKGILPVTAVTAAPLSDALRSKLTDKLSSVTGKTIELDCKIDRACLGGVRLDFDGKQVDGTVRRRLEDVRNILKNTVL